MTDEEAAKLVRLIDKYARIPECDASAVRGMTVGELLDDLLESLRPDADELTARLTPELLG